MARPGFRNHPKFRRLVRLLNLPDPYVYGLCEFLWSVAYESGNPIIGDEMDIELAAGWSGEAGALCAALLACGGSGRAGLIEPVSAEDIRLQIHDLLDHAPDYVTARASREVERSKEKLCDLCGSVYHSSDHRSMYCTDRCKVAACRNRVKPTATDKSVTATDAQPSETDCNRSPAPAPAPALKNKNAASTALRFQQLDPVEVFECAGKVDQWKLTQPFIDELSKQFPAVDVPRESLKALGWTKVNPKKKKTAAGMEKFLWGWMEREQNKGRTNGHQNGNGIHNRRPRSAVAAVGREDN